MSVLASSSRTGFGLPTRLAAFGVAAGAACLAYGAGYEVRSFRLRRLTLPLLPPGQRPLRILQVSDLHLTPDQTAKRDWVRGLAALEPDLVIDTGDNLAHPDAVPDVLDALGPLLDRPGAFVLGSNDYYAPRPKNPVVYLRGGTRDSVGAVELPWQDLVTGFEADGWVDLGNRATVLEADGRVISLRGVDDPHISRDDYDEVSGPAPDGVDLALGVVHAPYLRVLDAMAADGMPLILAGHTHGGQLRVPGYGALVSNCDLPAKRARGLSQHTDGTQLHVSAGLGTSPFVPVRFACPPEATLLTLVSP